MKVLVIGSNSFSGSNLVNKLLNEGYDVIGISRSEEYSEVFLPYKKNPRLKNFRFFNYNLNYDNNKIGALIKKERIKIFNFTHKVKLDQALSFSHYQTNWQRSY